MRPFDTTSQAICLASLLALTACTNVVTEADGRLSVQISQRTPDDGWKVPLAEAEQDANKYCADQGQLEAKVLSTETYPIRWDTMLPGVKLYFTCG